jgi:cell division septation protein DedD
MRTGSGFSSRRGTIVLWIIGFVVVIAMGVGLVWFGLVLDKRQAATRPSATTPATAAPLPSLMATKIPPTPTDTPLPTATPLPTIPISATATPVAARVVAGDDGANVRSGPDVSFTKLAYLDPGTEAKVVGRYEDWWQIEHGDVLAWVYDGVVVAYDVDGVPEVQPPAFPTQPPAQPQPQPQPTEAPAPTETPAHPVVPTQPSEFRGLVAMDFKVKDAPGPFQVDEKIWFDWDIWNTAEWDVEVEQLGAWVQETGGHTPTYKGTIVAGKRFERDDHVKIHAPGTYHIYLRFCLPDGHCENMAGPIEVIVEPPTA